MNRLEELYRNDVKFVYLNAQKDGEKAFKTANLRGHPALLLMRPDGEEIWRSVGISSYADIDTAIQGELSNT